MVKHVLLPCLFLAAVNCLGAYSSYAINFDYPWGIAVMTSGVFVFFLLLFQGSSADSVNTESKLRSAIAGGVVVQYLVLVGTVAFFSQGADQLPALTQTLITNFTSIVGVVIAFYFGSSAYVESQRGKEKKSA